MNLDSEILHTTSLPFTRHGRFRWIGLIWQVYRVAAFICATVLCRQLSAQTAVPRVWLPANDQERYVVSNVLAGLPAPLGAFREQQRVLSAALLDYLLRLSETNVTVVHKGILVGDAVFVDPIELRFCDVNAELFLTNCVFSNRFSLLGCHFRKSFVIEGSVFAEEARVWASQFDSFFAASGVKFLSETSFHTSKFSHGIEMNNAVFGDSVDFNFIEVLNFLSARNCQVWNLLSMNDVKHLLPIASSPLKNSQID
jgi:hypothetical protein